MAWLHKAQESTAYQQFCVQIIVDHVKIWLHPQQLLVLKYVEMLHVYTD